MSRGTRPDAKAAPEKGAGVMAEEEEVDVAEPQPDSEYRNASGMHVAVCHHCEETIFYVAGTWVHEATEGEECA